MYTANDPRASLAPAAAAAVVPLPPTFSGAEIGLFYQEPPQESGPEGKTWLIRGQNFIIAHSELNPGGSVSRAGQVDEYVVLVQRRDTPVTVEAGGDSKSVDGFSLIIVPPGDSTVTLPKGGTITRIFSAQSADLAGQCSNADSYAEQRVNIPAFEPWPAPPDGYRIRAYSLDVPKQAGRFGRIWRCTTVMVNVLDEQVGPRDVTQLSPHHHDDFEQCSLALEGSFIHHLRWPWTPNMNAWREDEHPHVGSPSVTVIPPPAIHTTRAMEPGMNQLIDIFAPPRIDFSQKAGWVLNADEYPMPA
ncbi:MAG: hypothetical protein JWR08_1302 [Enterovirga sp.]|nr:hypothetical protein [Enterovirga sp.]